jgi:hypothetical protein
MFHHINAHRLMRAHPYFAGCRTHGAPGKHAGGHSHYMQRLPRALCGPHKERGERALQGAESDNICKSHMPEQPLVEELCIHSCSGAIPASPTGTSLPRYAHPSHYMPILALEPYADLTPHECVPCFSLSNCNLQHALCQP